MHREKKTTTFFKDLKDRTRPPPFLKQIKPTWQYSSFIDKCHLIASKQAHFFDPVLST